MKKYIWMTCLISSLAACSGQNSFSPDEEDMQQASNVIIFQSKDGQNQWTLQAEQVDFEDMAHAVLTHPQLRLRQEGVDSAEVTGKRGIFDYTQKMVTIDGDARVHSLKENALLTTDRFFYDVDKDRIWSETKTIVIRDHTKITAKGGIETDSKLRKIELKQQTTQLPQNPNELRRVAK